MLDADGVQADYSATLAGTLHHRGGRLRPVTVAQAGRS